MSIEYKTRRFVQVAALVLGFLALMLATTRSAQAAVVTVCPTGGDFASVQPAIDAANAGDTIQLCAATYPEALRIDKDLILRGDGQTATIIGGQTLTTVVSLAPDATITLADLTLAQGNHVDAASMNAASADPLTDTITITNQLNLSGGDQVTTIINGDVSGNVAIVQANTKVYVVNVTIALPASDPAVVAALADAEEASSTFDGACILPLAELPAPLADLLADLCDLDALELAVQGRLDELPPSDATALATAALGAALGIDTNLILQGGDQVTTIVNGDVSGNLVIVQANTTVDVTNVTVSLTGGDADAPADPPPDDDEAVSKSHLLLLPIIHR